MKHILDFSIIELAKTLESWQEKSYHSKQIFSWIYKKGVTDFSAMSDLSATLRDRLKEEFFISSLNLIKSQRSLDETEKLLFTLKDKNLIEAVSIPTENRVTGCISTQAGCKFACLFCASGQSGFKRNLTCGEIIEQALYLKNKSTAGALTHIVFMGTGEPLDNYDNVLKAVRIINSPESFQIAARRITISTCGIIPGIKKLSAEGLQIELSVSLHAADDQTRAKIMPVDKRYPLKELITACKEYEKKTNRQVTFEYVLIEGLNSSLQSAANLAKMMKGWDCKVNLIPCNPIKELNLEPPEKKETLLFKNYLVKLGINVTLRKSRGQDIEAACGQLRLRYENK